MSEFDSWERATDYMHNLVPAPVLRAIGFLWFYIDKTPNFPLPPEILMTKLWHSDKINHIGHTNYIYSSSEVENNMQIVLLLS